jgi:hypothetical protein
VRGSVELRVFRVTDVPEGTEIRVTGWAAAEGARSELLPVAGLSGSGSELTGVVGPGPGLFVALARLTAEPDPAPLEEAVTVEVINPEQLVVRWREGAVLRVGPAEGKVAVIG